MKYLYKPSAARRLQQIPAGPGARLPANDGDIIETDDAAWVERINETVRGDNDLPALIAIAEQASAKPKTAAPAAPAPAPVEAERPALDSLHHAKLAKLAESLGYAGEDKGKAASLAFLGDCEPAEVDAAREALGY